MSGCRYCHKITGLGVSVTFSVSSPAFLKSALPHLVLPGWQHEVQPEATAEWEIEGQAEGSFTLKRHGVKLAEERADSLLQTFASHLHHDMASKSEFLIVHAGVVEHQGQIILLPGRSHAGKTTLVRALVEEGSTYYSDEYAVFDLATSAVLPFPRGMHLRHPTESIFLPDKSIRAGENSKGELEWIFLLDFESGSDWATRPIPRSQAVLGLFENTVAARTYGPKAIEFFEKVIKRDRAEAGSRGEAGPSARKILSVVDSCG